VALPAADPPDNHKKTVHLHADLAQAAGPVSDNIYMISLDVYRAQWLGNIRGDLLAGLVVALALIPEAIAFSIIAGVDPKVGLYASFSIAVITAITGGRPGMISAATAATAVLMVTLMRDHGLQYLLAATVLAGLIQIGAGVLKLGFVMRWVSKSVMTGFVNALAILIFMAQLPELDPREVTWITYALVAAGLAIIYLFPLLTTAIPSPLVTIVVLTGLAVALGLDVRTVGDMGALPDTLPVFLIPQIPLTFETLMIIRPYSVAVAVVGLLESMMTQNIVDDLTDTKSNRNQECIGQGVANTATGFIGGMAGCAMIGQSIINVKSGGRDHGLDRDLLLVLDQSADRASAILVHRDDRDGGDRGLHTQSRHRRAGRGSPFGHLLRRQDRAAVRRDIGDQP
jgi:SulP family sulfate permease